jgi:hypothetical protein
VIGGPALLFDPAGAIELLDFADAHGLKRAEEWKKEVGLEVGAAY